ncbi:DUF721 domain-containing protein [Desulfurispirillum indicum]|uniref:DUF721 domain-containing protein n=1 Tax=Desulfurispirillum indicum (strain ATCC BAA-1389 / DSM 22839 / S5) TaxID=653733 RepID=E6W4U9_DESIS|nr:DciA family protein [Desulfurispirillum indicum]ADU64827.1 protein of unknown function DUF721 [Desulfurispirillum indicum S5]UCZ56761.1 DUF721 domain-containing protein [Desulfurispirillum indicum]
MKTPQRLSHLLPSLLKQYDLDSGIEQHRIAALWPALVGEPMRYHTRVQRVTHDRLHVVVKEQRFLYPLSLLKPQILKAIVEKDLGNFRDITFSYSNRAQFEKAPPPAAPPRPLSPEEKQWCASMAQHIEGELADIFRRIVEKDLTSKR